MSRENTARNLVAVPESEANPVLEGRYRLGELLGEGGLSVVYSAWDRRLAREVAVKMLRAERASDELLRRFVMEARALAQLKSQHLVDVLDFGVTRTASGTRVPFMVLEHLSGCDLRAFSKGRSPLRPEWVALAVLQACDGLAAAHAAGIVHRDLKPENLFLVLDGSEVEPQIKVLDFGIARMPDSNRFGGGAVTFEGERMGSAGYTAPEQLCDPRDVDERTDIWSLGVVLYELLGGAAPFPGQTQREICISILNGRVRPLGELAPSLPAPLVAIVQRCLSVQREQRYANVLELARALLPYAGQEGLKYVRRIERRLPGSAGEAGESVSPSSAEWFRSAPSSQSNVERTSWPSARSQSAATVLEPRSRRTRRRVSRVLFFMIAVPVAGLSGAALASRLPPRADWPAIAVSAESAAAHAASELRQVGLKALARLRH